MQLVEAMMGEKLLNAKEVAQHLGVSLRTLETLIKQGQLPAFLRIGRQRRWRPEAIEEYLEEKAKAPAVPAPDTVTPSTSRDV